MSCSYKRPALMAIAIAITLLTIAFIWLPSRRKTPFPAPAAAGTQPGKASSLRNELGLPTGENTPPGTLVRYSQDISNAPPVLPGDKLSAALYKCAQKMVLSTLPEGSTLSALPGGKTELQLLDPHTALISGAVIIPGSGRMPEQHLRYQIKVYFLADGSCEAAFPEFTRIH